MTDLGGHDERESHLIYVLCHITPHLNIEEIKTMMTINTPTRAELRHKGIIKLNEPRKQRTAAGVESYFYHSLYYI